MEIDFIKPTMTEEKPSDGCYFEGSCYLLCTVFFVCVILWLTVILEQIKHKLEAQNYNCFIAVFLIELNIVIMSA